MRTKLDILLDLTHVYTGDEVHSQFFQNWNTYWKTFEDFSQTCQEM